MVELEEALEPLRILLVAFQAVDQGELLIHQRPAAPRQGLEHVVDLQLQVRLFACQQHGLLVKFVDGVRDLPDLLGGLHGERLHDAYGTSGTDAFQLAREVLVGHLEGAVAQPAQRAHDGACDQRHDQQRDEQRHPDDDGVPDGGDALLGRPLVDGRRDRGLRRIDDL